MKRFFSREVNDKTGQTTIHMFQGWLRKKTEVKISDRMSGTEIIISPANPTVSWPDAITMTSSQSLSLQTTSFTSQPQPQPQHGAAAHCCTMIITSHHAQSQQLPTICYLPTIPSSVKLSYPTIHLTARFTAIPAARQVKRAIQRHHATTTATTEERHAHGQEIVITIAAPQATFDQLLHGTW